MWRAWRRLGDAADVDPYVSGEVGAVLEDYGEEEAAAGGGGHCGRLLAACNRRWRGGAKSSGWNSSLFPVPFSVRARADRPSGSSEAHRRAALFALQRQVHLCSARRAANGPGSLVEIGSGSRAAEIDLPACSGARRGHPAESGKAAAGLA